jgi:heat shock protein HtpX
VSNFEALQKKNFRTSLLLVFSLFAVLSFVVYAFGQFVGGASSGVLTLFAVGVSAGSAGLSWWTSDRLVLLMTKARIVGSEEAPLLHNVVEEVAIAAGLPKPRVAVVDDPAPNAFATGRDPAHAVVAVTSGLLERMDRDELQAVVAHEMAHVANRDTLMMSVAAATAGVIALLGDIAFRVMHRTMREERRRDGGEILLLPVAVLAPVAAAILKAAISRSREGLADATAVEFTRNPSALRSALGKLAADSTVVRARSRSVAHLWIECPLDRTSALNRLYTTHPPITDRIAAIWRLEGGAGAPPPIPGYAPDPRETETLPSGFFLLVWSGISFLVAILVGPLLYGVGGVTLSVLGVTLSVLSSGVTPALAFQAWRRLRTTTEGLRWTSMAILGVVISGGLLYIDAISSPTNHDAYAIGAGALVTCAFLINDRRGGRKTKKRRSSDILAPAMTTVNPSEPAPTSRPVGGPESLRDETGGSAPVQPGVGAGRIENSKIMQATTKRRTPDMLEETRTALSATWVKVVIGLFAALLGVPFILTAILGVLKKLGL